MIHNSGRLGSGSLRLGARVLFITAFCSLLLLFVLFLFAASASTLAPPRVMVQAISQNARFEAESDPRLNETTIYSRIRGPKGGTARGAALWKFPAWLPVLWITNDGNVIVAESSDEQTKNGSLGGDNPVILRLIRKGIVMKEITLKEIVGSHAHLFPDNPDAPWGHVYERLDVNDHVLLDTAVGFVILDAQSGNLLFPARTEE